MKKLTGVFISLLVVVWLISNIIDACRPMRIYPMPNADVSVRGQKRENIVILNTKWKSKESILSLIEQYNCKTMSIDTVRKYPIFCRVYYPEKKAMELTILHDSIAFLPSADIDAYNEYQLLGIDWGYNKERDDSIWIDVNSKSYHIPFDKAHYPYIRNPFLLGRE
ncbi:MAG: hypothetical protein LBN24_02895 [Mediterranea sp.]|jgi:hypothetical protein|nr:hypothetical protein [Mediterranea sp.]